MKAKEDGKGMGRDTTVCGDPKTWFPMRVTYSREMKVKGELDRLGIENFVPMTYRLMESRKDGETEARKGGLRSSWMRNVECGTGGSISKSW